MSKHPDDPCAYIVESWHGQHCNYARKDHPLDLRPRYMSHDFVEPLNRVKALLQLERDFHDLVISAEPGKRVTLRKQAHNQPSMLYAFVMPIKLTDLAAGAKQFPVERVELIAVKHVIHGYLGTPHFVYVYE